MKRGRKPQKETTATPTPQFDESVKIMTVKEPETDEKQQIENKRQNNDVNILTLTQFYRNVANDMQTSPATKMMNVKKFVELHEGFQFPNHTADIEKIRYMETVAHFKLYEVDK